MHDAQPCGTRRGGQALVVGDEVEIDLKRRRRWRFVRRNLHVPIPPEARAGGNQASASRERSSGVNRNLLLNILIIPPTA